MPRYQITATYSSPVDLASEAHAAIGAAVEAAAVAQLRAAAGVGDVPPGVIDALTVLRAWYGWERLGLPVVASAAVPPGEIHMRTAGGREAVVINVGE